MENNTVQLLFNLRKCIYIDVRINIKMTCLLENIITRERTVDLIPTLCHKMAAADDVVNGNNFRVALVLASATFYDVHARCPLWVTERCEPLYVY